MRLTLGVISSDGIGLSEDDTQATKSENDAQVDFLYRRQVQLLDNPHWEEDEDQVHDAIRYLLSQQIRLHTDAMTFDQRLPGFLNWCAREGERQHGCQTPRHTDDHHDSTCKSESLIDEEYSSIEEQYTEFGRRDCEDGKYPSTVSGLFPLQSAQPSSRAVFIANTFNPLSATDGGTVTRLNPPPLNRPIQGISDL